VPRVAFVNGRYLPFAQAAVHVEDRGFQFADGVYEVCEIRGGQLVDERRHMARLSRSLNEISITLPISLKALGVVLRETVRQNRVRDGLVYLQVTRGKAKRDFAFPPHTTRPSLVVTARSKDRQQADEAGSKGISVITLKDNRWDRVDIKTTGLLPNVLARQEARAKGAEEAWFVDAKGYVTEGSSSNAWIASGKTLITRPAEHGILRGITRTVVFDVAKELDLVIEERPFSVEEALAAEEAFITAATQIVMPVIKIDSKTVGSGKPGPVARALRARFHDVAEISE
jgi:D-alanine transaminase